MASSSGRRSLGSTRLPLRLSNIETNRAEGSRQRGRSQPRVERGLGTRGETLETLDFWAQDSSHADVMLQYGKCWRMWKNLLPGRSFPIQKADPEICFALPEGDLQ